MRYSIQHDNITTTASRGQGGSRFEPQPKGYGMSQNHHFECTQAFFDSYILRQTQPTRGPHPQQTPTGKWLTAYRSSANNYKISEQSVPGPAT